MTRTNRIVTSPFSSSSPKAIRRERMRAISTSAAGTGEACAQGGVCQLTDLLILGCSCLIFGQTVTAAMP